MSLRVIRAGVLDTVQDLGRYGFQYLGINPGGVMDQFAARAVNMLVGNAANEPVIEMHFPASVFLFEQETMIAIGGADFSPAINGDNVPLWHPLILSKNSVLQFQKWKHGARCYLAIKEKLRIEKWLNSFGTNLKAGCGGFNGRSLQKEDVVPLREYNEYKSMLKENDFTILHWQADNFWSERPIERIAVIPGNEWDCLLPKAKEKFLNEAFVISSIADRMGYFLQGKLKARQDGELVSSGVSFGTIQLLPAGELIILMADHQTAGGYPRIAHVISAHLPLLAQKRAGDKIYFRMTDLQEAEDLLLLQEQHLRQLQNACAFKLEEYLAQKRR